MSEKLRPHVANLLEYLNQKSERNEDLALGYFRHLFKSSFKRQSDAGGADGYVPGHFVLELKGKGDDWYQAFFQALAYQNKDLAFSIVVVACSRFLAFWRVDEIPADIRAEVLEHFGKAPNTIGKQLASKYKNCVFRSKRPAIPERFGHLPSRFLWGSRSVATLAFPLTLVGLL